MVDSIQIINKLSSMGINVVKGYKKDTHIYFDHEQPGSLELFYEFIQTYSIKFVFYNLDILTEDAIEVSLIDEVMLANKGIPSAFISTIQASVNDCNNRNSQLRSQIGQEQSVNLFVAIDGIIYSYLLMDDAMYPLDPEEFINVLIEEHGETIEMIQLEKARDRREVKDLYLQKIEKHILNDEAFKKCTNANLRREYICRIYEQTKPLDLPNITTYELNQFIDKVWRSYKYG